ncbi:MAG: hypothetical protein M1829_000294 [Trizodia sp. TS-e1964]|nr:MAG: hypothetical protein M1829_000294 [Trizodia sp. TS-e1964]
MSDFGRKGVAEQTKEKITPDSTKSTGQKTGENVSGYADKVIGAIQPNESKSTTQSASDTTRSNADAAQKQGDSLAKQATDTVSGIAKSVNDTVNSTFESLSGATKTNTNVSK